MSEPEKTLADFLPPIQTVENWVAGKTRNGKTLFIRPCGRGLYTIHMDGGGRFPKALKGSYTSIQAAQDSVDTYLTQLTYITKQQVEDRKAKENAKKSG